MPKRTVAAADEGLPNSDQPPVRGLADSSDGLAIRARWFRHAFRWASTRES